MANGMHEMIYVKDRAKQKNVLNTSHISFSEKMIYYGSYESNISEGSKNVRTINIGL